MPKIDLAALPVRSASIYPAPYAAQMAGRSSIRPGDAAGLTQFGANIVTLQPGALASLRHWHSSEDEFAIVLEGILTLVEDDGPTEMRPGDCAAWKAGSPNAHRFENRSSAPARFLVVGTKAQVDTAIYPDVDLVCIREAGAAPRFTRHDGSPLEPQP